MGDARDAERLDVPLEAQFEAADELALGEAVAGRLLAELPLWDSDLVGAYVSYVGMRLLEGEAEPGPRWVFALVDSDAVNAFSLPGGFVFVTRGALEQCASEAQLAALLAHEIAHVQGRHALRTLDVHRLDVLRDASRQELDALVEPDEALAELVADLQQVGDELHAMTQAPYSQGLEREADAHAVRLLWRAGYALAEAEGLLEAAGRDGGGSRFSSHPPAADRLAVVRDEVARVLRGGDDVGSVGLERMHHVVEGALLRRRLESEDAVAEEAPGDDGHQGSR